MSTRFGVGVLLVVVSLVLATMLAACVSSSPSPPSSSSPSPPSPSPASPQAKGSTPDWLAFRVEMERFPGQVRTVAQAHSIQEMETIGGFSFVFPSYLPAGIGKSIYLGALAKSTADPTPDEFIELESERKETPSIFISESLCNQPCDFAGVTTLQIGDTGVACEPQPIGWLELECRWQIEDKIFSAVFDWQIISATPTPDMKQEAMKVVESMILSPTHP